MNCVILYRINGGQVQAITFGGDIHEFASMDDAVGYINLPPQRATFSALVDSGQADYQIVELDEL